MEQILSLDTVFLGHFLHVCLVCLGEVALSFLEAFHRGFGVRQGEFSGVVFAEYPLGQVEKVSLFDHGFGLGTLVASITLELIKGGRQTVPQHGLGVQDSVLGGLHSFSCQRGSGKGHVDQAQIGLGGTLLEQVLEFELVLDQVDDAFQGDHFHVLLVDPPQFFHVKDGGRFDDAAQLKGFDEFVTGKNLVVGTIVPPQQGQVVDHGVRQESIQSELVAGGGPVSLRQLLLVLSQDERAVGVLGTGGAQAIQNQSLPDCVGQMLLGANDGGDPHQGVVDGDTEIVDRNPVRPQQNEISDGRFGVPGDGAADGIVDDDPGTLRDLESHRVGRSSVHHLVDFLLGGISPPSVVAWGNSGGLLLGPHFLEFLVGTKAAVDLALGEEFFGRLHVNVGAFRLAVGSVPSAIDDVLWALVPQHAQPG
mmetsp:Transcript_7782/g.16715  ORF Transcript_7782/g.16715 Transcript_7782/m.16715 type:complete len:421 (-) Transcript_7782:647-1909(-)